MNFLDFYRKVTVHADLKHGETSNSLRVLCIGLLKSLASTLSNEFLTRRERLKSALYLKLKKRKVFKMVKGGSFPLFENPVSYSLVWFCILR